MRDRTVFRVFAPVLVAVVAIVGVFTSGCSHTGKEAGTTGAADANVGQQNAAGQAQAYQQKAAAQNPGQSAGQDMAAGQAQAHQGGAPQ